MSTRPVVFNETDVLTTLDGLKISFRRPCLPQPPNIPSSHSYGHLALLWWTEYWKRNGTREDAGRLFLCPFGCVGEFLWVKETWRPKIDPFKRPGFYPYTRQEVIYKADCCGEAAEGPWRRSSEMMQTSSRIILLIKEIKVERLHNMTSLSACFDGYPSFVNFINDWDHRYGKRNLGWRENPWVWVVRFIKEVRS